jgi:putative transposase
MARPKSTHIRRSLRTLLPATELRSIGLNTGFLARSRKFNLTAFLSTLVFGGAVVARRSVQALWVAYVLAARDAVSKSAFQRWVAKPQLVAWLEGLLATALERSMRRTTKKLAGALAQFRDLFVADSSVLRLSDCLAGILPGTGKSHGSASLKLHVVQRVAGGGIRSFKTTEGKAHDSKHFHVGPWVQDGLLLVDLGYYCFRRFARIDALGGFFISRVKDKANPWIVRSLRSHRGRKVPIAGERLQAVLARLRRRVLDLEVEVEYYPRAYRGSARKRRMILRLVGIWDQTDRCYHLFFTNVPPEKLSAKQVADAYRLRWQVELYFRELKGVHRLEELPGTKPHILRAMVLASLLSGLVTRRLLADLRERVGLADADLPHEQGAILMHVVAMPLLLLASGARRHLGALERHLERKLAYIARVLRTKRCNLLRQLDNLTGDPAMENMIWCGI